LTQKPLVAHLKPNYFNYAGQDKPSSSKLFANDNVLIDKPRKEILSRKVKISFRNLNDLE